MEKVEKSENIESQQEFLSKMLELIPYLESNGHMRILKSGKYIFL